MAVSTLIPTSAKLDSFLIHELTNQLSSHSGTTVRKAQHSIRTTNKGAIQLRGSGLNFTTQGIFHHGFERNPTPSGNAFSLNKQVIGKVDGDLHMGDLIILRELVKSRWHKHSFDWKATSSPEIPIIVLREKWGQCAKN